MKKKYKLDREKVERLIPPMGACIATDQITVEGVKVGFMYREELHSELDSGWRLFSGTETQEYLDDFDNSEIFDLNVIANYDPAIIPYLKMPIGTSLERVEGKDEFVVLEEE